LKNIVEYRDHYTGRPGIVIGGGAAAPRQIASLPADVINDAVLYAVNHHAFHLLPPHYIDHVVYMDNPLRDRHKALANIAGAVRNLDSERVLTHPGRISQNPGVSSFGLPFKGFWDGGFSSTLATWCACYMGCDPVILVGMDCYQVRNEKGSLYLDGSPDPQAAKNPLKDHIAAWRPALDHCPHPDRIVAAGGPLVEIFGRYRG
jgi:hypothetical protein